MNKTCLSLILEKFTKNETKENNKWAYLQSSVIGTNNLKTENKDNSVLV